VRPRRNHTSAFLLLLVFALGASSQGRAVPERVAPRLRAFAARADSQATWPQLLRYADAQQDPEQKGLAYFVLGYREYDADANDLAIPHLQLAAATNFSLADFAEFYAAAAATESHQPDVVVQSLSGFDRKYPDSTLREAALELYGRALVDSGKPQKAVEALTANSRVRQEPELALLLANALRAAAKPEDAARIYQEIYYAFPASGEADDAQKALNELRAELGSKFPEVPEEIQTARADKLFQASKFKDALDDYQTLLSRNSSSPLVARWTVGRARCLTRLRRISDALDALQKAVPQDPATDAERLSALVDIYARQDDPESLDLILQQMAKLYSSSTAYASALDAAGNYFVRKGDWPRAAGYYQTLAQAFPKTSLGAEASWRVAWTAYLQKNYVRARNAFETHLKEYPDSWHRAAALHWLGRMAEDHGAGGAARKLYGSVVGRYGQSYYATLSAKRLTAMADNRSGFDSSQAGDWSELAEVADHLPTTDSPPLAPCATPERGPELDRFATLRALSLDDLAENYLRDVAAQQSGPPEVYIALGRFEVDQDKPADALFDAVRAVHNYSELQFDQLPKVAWDLLYPRSYWSLVHREAKARGLDPYLVMGLIRQESAFNPRAVSVANARGLMQILPRTVTRRRSRRRAEARRLLNPAYNVRIGTGILQKLSKIYDGNMEEAMAAYHAGPSRVDDWRSQNEFRDSAEFLETIPIPATRIYVERVIRDAAVYRKLLTGTAMFAHCENSRGQGKAAQGRSRNLPMM
jgi:peptidoglycan lytic transglycosylase